MHHLLNQTELRQLVEDSSDALYVLIVRGPCDWAVSMKKNPWHLCPPNHPRRCAPGSPLITLRRETTMKMTLAEFFRMPWKDSAELVLSNWMVNATYTNVFDLRAHKLQLMQQVRDVPPRIKLIHFRDMEAAPHRVIQEMQEEFNLNLSKSYKPLPPSDRLHRQPCLTAEEHALAVNAIDWEVEALFGYFPHDCHTCGDTSH